MTWSELRNDQEADVPVITELSPDGMLLLPAGVKPPLAEKNRLGHQVRSGRPDRQSRPPMRVLCDSSVLIAALLPSKDLHAASAAVLNVAVQCMTTCTHKAWGWSLKTRRIQALAKDASVVILLSDDVYLLNPK